MSGYSLVHCRVTGHRHFGLVVCSVPGEEPGHIDESAIADEPYVAAGDWPRVGAMLWCVVLGNRRDGRLRLSSRPRDVALADSVPDVESALAAWRRVRDGDTEVEVFLASRDAAPVLRWALRRPSGTPDRTRAGEIVAVAPGPLRAAVMTLPVTNVRVDEQPGVRLACPCCGALTLTSRGWFEICPGCGWEDDGQDDHDADEVRGAPNKVSLTAARANVREFGASERRRIKPLSFHVDATGLEATASGAIWGPVWWTVDGAGFPQPRWSDLVVAVAVETLTAVRHTTGSRRVRFFDGPYWIDVSSNGVTTSTGTSFACDARALAGVLHQVEQACTELLIACRERGWGDHADVRRLASLL